MSGKQYLAAWEDGWFERRFNVHLHRLCCGYPDCDGDLVAEPHEACCPAYLSDENYDAAAAAYTDDVLAEAARMQAEMDLVREQLPSGVDWSRWSRILSRLQALYDAHVRGLKSEALR